MPLKIKAAALLFDASSYAYLSAFSSYSTFFTSSARCILITSSSAPSAYISAWFLSLLDPTRQRRLEIPLAAKTILEGQQPAEEFLSLNKTLNANISRFKETPSDFWVKVDQHFTLCRKLLVSHLDGSINPAGEAITNDSVQQVDQKLAW